MKRKVKRRKKSSHKTVGFDNTLKMVTDLSTITVATSAGLALMKGSKEALKR